MKIKTLAGLLVFISSLTFYGCGGGGGENSTTTTTTNSGTISGTITLPANTNAKLFQVPLPFYARLFINPSHAATITDLTTLTVTASGVTTRPDTQGKFSMTVPYATNVEVAVTAPSGNIVLEAITTPNIEYGYLGIDINTTSTAVALIWKQNQSLSLSQIQSSDSVTVVKNAIESALTDDAIDSIASNSSVTKAVQDAVNIVSIPSGVTMVAGDRQATISWVSVPGATSYNLYMASQSSVTKNNYSSKTGGMKHENVTSPYTHTGLTSGTTYYFVVTAVNSAGESSESSEVSTTPKGPNNNPVVSITASPNFIGINKTSTISCLATDKDNDTLSYSWSKTGGTLSSTTSQSVVWSAPSTPGTYTLGCYVADGKGGEAQGYTDIEVTNTGGVTVTW